MFFAPLFASLLALPQPGSARDVPTRAGCERDEAAAALPIEVDQEMRIVNVDPESPVSNTLLRAGDYLEAVDDVRVMNRDQLSEILASRCPGQRTKLMITGEDGPQEIIIAFERGEILAPPIAPFELNRREEARELVLRAETIKPKAEVERWYGWQTLLTDAGTVAILALAASNESGELLGAFFVSYGFSPAIVHLANGNYVGMGASLAGRVGIPLTSALLFGTVGCLGDGDCDRGEVISQRAVMILMGTVLGMVGATIFDAAALAWSKEEFESGLELN
jgi:hypothetical protein